MPWELGPATRILLGERAGRPSERAAAYLQTQVERRTGWRWEIARGGSPAPASVLLGTPADGVEGRLRPEHLEEVVLWCGGDPDRPAVAALAGGPSTVLAAAGRLARTLELHPGLARLPRLAQRSRPAYPLRGHTLANHKQTTTYDKWDWAHWEEYLTELAAWGSNVAILYPLHPARWRGALPFAEPPWFDSPARAAEFERQWAIQRRLPALCRELGLRYGIWVPANDVFPAEVAREPALTRHGGAYVCPSLPAARQRIAALRERLFAALPHLDVLFIPSRDDGGCPGCERCTPWAPVYLELVREQAALARRHHPGCQVWLSLQGLDAAEAGTLLGWLDRERPDWVEAVAHGPFGEAMTFGEPGAPGEPAALGGAAGPAGELSLEGHGRGGTIAGPPARLRAALPGRYRLVLYPDATHTFRCQYPVVGMDPAVQYVWDRENGPAPRPRETARLHGLTAPGADGSIPYSEGNTDDVNKLVWSALAWEPALSGEAVAVEYARWFFGPAVAPAAATLILKLEEALGQPLAGCAAVAEAAALVRSCEAREPALLESWRWLCLRLGALLLEHVQQIQARDRELAATLRYRVAAWRDRPDPRSGLRATLHYLEGRFAENASRLDEIVWTRDRLFAHQRLAVRGVSRLQHSYHRLDVLAARWREVLARLEAGELRDFPERQAAILGPLREAEDALRLAVQGIGLVEPLREFAWETGETTWP